MLYAADSLILPEKSIPNFIKYKVPIVFKQISCGSDHTLLMDDKGQIYSQGNNSDGQLGVSFVMNSQSPIAIQAMVGKIATKIYAGGRHSLALIGHDLWSWGCGKNYRLGDGQTSNSNEPKWLKTGLKIVDISCGWSHSFFRTKEGQIYTFGKGASGQCGVGTFDDIKVPTLVKSLEKQKIKTICAGYDHSVCLTENGEVLTFGGGSEGQLGHKDMKNIAEPKIVSAFDQKIVLSIACGPFHTIAVCASNTDSVGRVDTYVWGKAGKLKNPNPHVIESMRNKSIMEISCSLRSTVALIDPHGVPIINNSIPSKMTESRSPEISSSITLRHGVASLQGARKTMEDCHNTIPLLKVNGNTLSYYAIFDGYGGALASKFCEENMHTILVKHLSSIADWNEALKATFLDVDKQFLEKAEKEAIQGGTTATIALVLKSRLYVANVGDSESVLCRNGKAVTLTNCHNMLKSTTEEQRIKKLGGIVYHKRLGHLNWNPAIVSIGLTRAIGDIFYKHEKFTSGKQTGLISIPDVTQVQLTEAEQFLIIGCDGLWAVVSPQEACDLIGTILQESNNPQLAAKELANMAAQKGSLDNITVLVVNLQE
jgi:serine/threonine protein phosphatase PrpC